MVVKYTDVGCEFQSFSDDELARYITKLIREGTDGAMALLQSAKRHGGPLLVVRVARLLRVHGPTGSGEHLWNRASGNRLVLVEGSNA